MADTKSRVKTVRKPAVVATAVAAAAGAAAAGAARARKSNEGKANMTNEATQAAQDAAQKTQAFFADVNDRAKVAADKTQKIVEELTDLARGNVEALVASSKVAAKGAEALGQDAAEYGRKRFEEASATLRSLSEAKTPADFFRLQSEFAKSAFDSFVAESAKVSETMVKLAGDVAEPITSRYSVAADRMKGLATVA
ncbi:phasin family protein [Allosphingosinicella flava]|uniref:Phasin family protein n=1 Tax=Allosphingosinicella flava TaxID=2771430 RepID=A0A7T2GK14_9SPHN|nr:phasin family protein [Sphingosinicella flava]QPQ54918.1 phasin family protein [Sphingosinicella flava]